MASREGLGKTSRKGKVALSVCAVLLGVFVAIPSSCFAFPHHQAFFAAGQEHGRHNSQARPPYQGRHNQESRPAYQGPQRSPYQAPQGQQRHQRNGPAYRGNQEHLGAWLRQHGGMSLADQQRSLQQEPGFSRLPSQTQRQLMNRLGEIDSMPPVERQRTVDRIEAMEHLSPERRQQVRASVQAIRTLPPDRQRVVKRAFRELREYPPGERESILSSPQFENQFNPRERGILSNVLAVEPYEPRGLPPPPPGR